MSHNQEENTEDVSTILKQIIIDNAKEYIENSHLIENCIKNHIESISIKEITSKISIDVIGKMLDEKFNQKINETSNSIHNEMAQMFEVLTRQQERIKQQNSSQNEILLSKIKWLEYNDNICIDKGINISINPNKAYDIKSPLKEQLKKIGKTQSWLSEQTGISNSTLSNIISNPNSISLLNAYKIGSVLNMKIEKLFIFKETK